MYGVKMDRRQRKSREAIFNAFIKLLSERDFNQITVAEIINEADVGRATFYAHFETKDYLLKELCEELFCHIFDSINDNTEHRHIFECNAPDSVFLHLLRHLKNNDNNIFKLLGSQNNELFLRYFKTNLQLLIKNQLSSLNNINYKNLPDNFIINHISSTFVETVKWWVDNGMKQSPEEINEYFYMLIK